MTDFIDRLEEQLVAAHGRAPRRRPALPPWRTTIVFAGAAATVVAVVVAVLALASSDPGRGGQPAGGQTTPPRTTPVHPVAPTPIAVLNGTTVTGLARAAADKLMANGYHAPSIVTNDETNQSRQTSEVFYADGRRTEAFGVADCLGIRFDHVHEMNAEARALGDRAEIVVLLGADQAR